jgi:ADP-heptose:LPS heptosyltransferase
MRILGFNAGQYGDLAMCVVACQLLKENLDCHITFGIGNRYADCKEAFLHNPYIDDIHIWDSYNEWPKDADVKYMVDSKFDKIFSAMPTPDSIWYVRRHQTQELCRMHELPYPKSTQINLNKYWQNIDKYKDYVAISSFTSFGESKSIDINKIKRIIDYIHSKGLKAIHLNGPNEPDLGIEKSNCSYFESIKIMSSCKFLFTADTGMNWYASGYRQKVVGLYGYKYYPHCTTSKNWQPTNKNAIYLEAEHANLVNDQLIFSTIDSII